ncbi:hypothetical protein ACLB1T_15550 [Escherichia coli]
MVKANSPLLLCFSYVAGMHYITGLVLVAICAASKASNSLVCFTG